MKDSTRNIPLLPKLNADEDPIAELKMVAQESPLAPLTKEKSLELCCVGQMPLYSAVFNLSNTIIGSGTLTMPFIFAQVGWLPANLISLAIMLLTLFSAYLLVVASDNAGGECPILSFEALGYRTCGALGSFFAECTFVFGGLGTCTSYMIFVGQLIAQVMGLEMSQAYIPIVLIMVLVVVPLTWPRSINALRHTSLVAVMAVVFVVFMYAYFWCGIRRYDDDPSRQYVYEEPQLATMSPQSINSINLLIGAYCVQNTCLPVYGELRCRSPRKMVMATGCAMLVSFFVYEVIGFSGYFLLGGQVKSNSLLNLDANFVRAHPWTELARDAAKALMSCLIALSVPLAMWPCRSAVCSVLIRAGSGCEGPHLGSEFASDALFHAVTLVFLCVVTLLAILIPDITIPLGVVNSLAGGSMIFVMPGLFYLGSLERHRRFSLSSLPALAMIALGLAVSILGFALELRSIQEKYGGAARA